ncbi:single-stranded DNA-binding protein [Klebsiella pneumoniae]
MRHRPRWFTPLRRTALKRVKVTTSVGVQQVPAKRQNRGSRNSTDDGG